MKELSKTAVLRIQEASRNKEVEENNQTLTDARLYAQIKNLNISSVFSRRSDESAADKQAATSSSCLLMLLEKTNKKHVKVSGRNVTDLILQHQVDAKIPLKPNVLKVAVNTGQ